MVTAYTICAVVGITIFIVQLVLMFSGLDGDGDLDVGSTDLAHDGQVHMMEDTQVANGGGNSFFNLLSFRAIVAAVAFFGVGGRIGEDLDWPPVLCFVLAVSTGLAALVVVGWLMAMLASLRHDGSIRLHNAFGQPASVYLGIPEHRSGVGRVSVTMQGRSMEFDALTDGDAIPTGGQAIVVDVVNDTTVLVSQDGVRDAVV